MGGVVVVLGAQPASGTMGDLGRNAQGLSVWSVFILDIMDAVIDGSMYHSWSCANGGSPCGGPAECAVEVAKGESVGT